MLPFFMRHLSKFALFEKHLLDISQSDIINKKFVDLQHVKGFLGPFVSQYMDEEHREFFNFEEDESKTEEIIKSEYFQNWLYYELETQFDQMQYNFEQLIDNNQITLYRAMSVESKYIDKLLAGHVKRIGRYFSHEFDKAEPHWGYNDDNKKDVVIFEIKINEEYVDWIETFRLNLEHEYYNEEDEIRLFKNTPVQITNIWWNGKEIDKQLLLTIQKYNYLS